MKLYTETQQKEFDEIFELNEDKKQTLKNTKPIKSAETVDKKQLRKEQAELRKKASPLRKQADKYEKKVQVWQAELAEVEAVLAESEIYQSEHKSRLATLIKQQASLKADIEENEMHWLELEEQIEEIMMQASI